uniref:Uncharacterized protein n=1 Tax=Clastoptera arizonana TaxID=38151 RepID=A0A1B6CSX0_9HEMI
MNYLVSIVLLSLGYLAFAENLPGCKDIDGLASFDFKSFAGKQYSFYLLPDIEDTKPFLDSTLTFSKVADTSYIILTGNLKNGNQVNNEYAVDSVEGAQIFQTQLADGVPTSVRRAYTVLDYQPNKYALLYLCGKELSERYPNVDLRFVITFGDVRLTKEETSAILDVDNKYNFNGNFVRIGDDK